MTRPDPVFRPAPSSGGCETVIRPAGARGDEAAGSQRTSRLLTAVARSVEEILAAENLHAALGPALSRIGEALPASRIRLTHLEWTPENPELHGWHETVHEWTAGTRPRSCALPRAAMLRNDAQWSELFRRLGLHSHEGGVASAAAAVPADGVTILCAIQDERTLWGLLAIDRAARPDDLPMGDLAALRTVAAAIASGIRRLGAADVSPPLSLGRDDTCRALALLHTFESGADLDDFLAERLRQSIGVAGAQSGAVAVIAGATLRHRVILTRRGRVPSAEMDASGLGCIPMSSGVAEFAAHLERQDVSYAIDPQGPQMPPCFREFHRAEGNVAVRLVPMRAKGRVLGWVGLGFASEPEESEETLAVLRRLGDQMTLALELVRLAESARAGALTREQHEMMRRRVASTDAHNAVLRQSAARLANTGNSSTALGVALAELAGALQADVGHLFVFAAETRTLHLRSAWRDGVVSTEPSPTEPPLFGHAIPYNVSPIFAALCEGRKFIQLSRGDFAGQTWPGVDRWFDQERFRDAIALALMVGDRPVGLFACAFRRQLVLTSEQVDLLYALAAQIALAIELAQLAGVARDAAVVHERERAERKRVVELTRANEALLRTTALLTGKNDLSSFLCAVSAEATAMSGAKSAGVFAYDAATSELRMIAFMTDGVALEIATDPRMALWRNPVPEPIAARWVETLRANDYSWFDNTTPLAEHPWPISLEWHREFQHRFVIDVPLYAGGELIGMLGQCFASESWPDGFDFERTRILANHAGLALQLHRLASQARDAATAGAVLRERNRIARDLHDTLAQGFTGVLAQLGAAEGAVELQQPEQLLQHLERAKSLARLSLAEARASVHALRPETNGGPLRERFKRMLAAMTQGTRLQAAVREVGDPRKLGPAADWCAHKFVQEALANAVKHSGATQFTVDLRWGRNELHLSAIDNGCGFDQQLVELGVGLLSMRERAVEAGGRVTNESLPGQGAHLCLHLPLLHPGRE